MARRARLTERAAPFLEPGEQVRAIFLAQYGAAPYLGAVPVTAWIALTAGFVTVVVTDRAIVVLRNGRLSGSRAKSLLARLPRQPLGSPAATWRRRWVWTRISLGGTRYWVHMRFRKEVDAANASIEGRLAQ
jgi:hypothetical protein